MAAVSEGQPWSQELPGNRRGEGLKEERPRGGKRSWLGGRVSPNRPRNWTSALPVNFLPPSFSRGVASLGRGGPRVQPVPSLYARFFNAVLPSALEQAGQYGGWPGRWWRAGSEDRERWGALGIPGRRKRWGPPTQLWEPPPSRSPVPPVFRLRCAKGFFQAHSTMLIDFSPAKCLGFV